MTDDPVITLSAVGDIMLGDLPTSFGFGVGSVIAREGADFPFVHVRELLLRSDIAVGNLECVISKFDPERDPFERIQIRAQPEAAKALKRAGFTVLSFATNHTMQHGKAAVVESVRHLAEQGITVCGIDLPELALKPEAILERSGLKVGFLNFNLRPQQYFLDDPLWAEPTTESMQAAISSLRPQVDVLVVALHWGDEFIDYPSPGQVNAARQLVEAGADVILGHHPHILQGVERYKQGLIAYSMGNFVFDMWQPEYRRSMILQLRLSRRGVQDFAIVPALINGQYQVEVLEGKAGDDARRSIEALAQKVDAEGAHTTRYLSDVSRRTRVYQGQVYRHYLANALRYPPRRLLQNLRGALWRRLKI